MSTLGYNKVILSIHKLGLTIPFNDAPGSYPGGHIREWTETTWNAYQWNPPQFLQTGTHTVDGKTVVTSSTIGANYVSADPNASPKPTWAELQAAFTVAAVSEFKTNTVNDFRSFTAHLISVKAYGAKDATHELQIKERLASDNRLTRMNEYKEFYRGRYHEIKHWLNELTEDSAGQTKITAWRSANINLSALDGVVDDNAFALFSGANWTPPGEQTAFADHSNVPDYTYITHDNPPPSRGPGV